LYLDVRHIKMLVPGCQAHRDACTWMPGTSRCLCLDVRHINTLVPVFLEYHQSYGKDCLIFLYHNDDDHLFAAKQSGTNIQSNCLQSGDLACGYLSALRSIPGDLHSLRARYPHRHSHTWHLTGSWHSSLGRATCPNLLSGRTCYLHGPVGVWVLQTVHHTARSAWLRAWRFIVTR
jgi:hypothetical protein